MRRLPVRVMAVLESDFMDQFCIQNRALTHLDFSIVRQAIESALQQRETTAGLARETILAEALISVILSLVIKVCVERVALVDRELRSRIHAASVIGRYKRIEVLQDCSIRIDGRSTNHIAVFVVIMARL